MRRAPALLAGAALLLGACGGDDDAPPSATTAGEDPGLRVFRAQGCGSCHALEAAGSSGDFGPNLGETLKGRKRDYVIESIIAPGAKIAPGYGAGMMPEDYATRIPRADVDRLADFLVRAARGD